MAKTIVDGDDVIIAASEPPYTAGATDAVGDIILRTGGTERARITAAGVGSGFGALLGGSLPDIEAAYRLQDKYERSIFSDIRYPTRGVVSLLFADGPAVDSSTIAPLLDATARNLVAAFSVVNSTLNTSTYMTTAQLLALAKNGHEVMHHSRSHTDVTSDTNFIDETTTALAELRLLGPFYCESFNQPGTWTGNYFFDDAAKADGTNRGNTTRATYASASAYITDGQRGNTISLPPIRRFFHTQNTLDTMTLVAAQAAVDQAITLGGLCQFGCHASNIGTASHLSLADFTTLLDYIVTKRDAGLITVLTPTGAMFAQQGPQINQLTDPSFDASTTATFVGWQTSGSPSVVPGRTTNAAQCSLTNQVFQDLKPWNYRTLYIECYAKSTGANATGRVIVQTSGSVVSQPTSVDKQVAGITSSAWTKIAFHVGNHPDADNYWRIKFTGINADPDILYSDIKVVKV